MKIYYKLRINYKSGIQEEFWCSDFKIDGDTYTWVSKNDTMKPVKIGVDCVESVWQVDYKYRLWWLKCQK